MYLRSGVFLLAFALITVLIALVFSPFLLFRCRALYWTGYVWSKVSLFLLKLICNVDYKIEGAHHLPDAPFIVASKHQSVFETVAFWSIFYIPTFVLKKELLKIPFFGIYLKQMRMISIDRSAGVNALKSIVEQSDYHLINKRHIIIFPEGTRTRYGQRTNRYLPGVTALYMEMNVTVVPVALNSGKFWPSKSGVKKAGTIIIKVLPPIKPGVDRKDFAEALNHCIEDKSLLL